MTRTPARTALIRRALDLAHAARRAGDPPFGSLLADAAGTVLAEEVNTTLTDDDITAHPELKLARWAARSLAPPVREGLTMYTSCEPCPMCANAIGRAGIPRVVYALSNDRLLALKPPGAPAVSRPFDLDGPHLPGESAAPVAGYYL
ncbi:MULTISPECIES: nucleoside deaminase [unclassified Nocardiopsis]|uniref:nucleoside deaminase n=1 Tax=Nocardiopsis TaxID=2013 RepID=UPI00387AF724